MTDYMVEALAKNAAQLAKARADRAAKPNYRAVKPPQWETVVAREEANRDRERERRLAAKAKTPGAAHQRAYRQRQKEKAANPEAHKRALLSPGVFRILELLAAHQGMTAIELAGVAATTPGSVVWSINQIRLFATQVGATVQTKRFAIGTKGQSCQYSIRTTDLALLASVMDDHRRAHGSFHERKAA